MNKHLIVIGVAVLLLVVGLSGCVNNPFSDESKFIGKWKYLGSTAWIFRKDGTCETPLGEGTYIIEKGKLTVDIGSIVVTYDYTFLDDNNKLHLDRSSKSFTLEREV